jgi:macrodomain Ter protein organizer (MatP/YcbG family)
VQVRGTAQTLDCIKDLARTREDTTVSGVLQQFFKRYLERDTNEKNDKKHRIEYRVDYVTWARLQVRAKQKNMSLSSLCMNILEEQIIEYKKNEMK